MGVVFRQSAKNLVVTMAGAALGALVIWLSTKYIGKREFGFLGNFTNYAIAAAQLLLFGLNNTLAVYIHRFYEQAEKKKALFTWSLLIPGALAVLFSVIYLALKPWVLAHFQVEDRPFMDRYYLLLPAYVLVFIYLIMFEQYLSAHMKVAVSAFMREVVVRLLNIILILCFAAGLVNFDWLVGGTIAIYLLPIMLLIVLSSKVKHPGISFKWAALEPADYKELFHFSWYHFLLVASVLLMGYMDSVLLPFYDSQGFKSVAVYRIAIYLISILQMPMKAMAQASFAALARAFADEDISHARDLFRRSSANIFIASTGVAAVLLVNLTNLNNLLPAGYEQMIGAFLILFVGYMINIATGMNDQVLSISKYYKFNFYLSTALIVALFIGIRVWVPLYGIYGAALATSVTLALFNVVKTGFLWRKLAMMPITKGTLLTLVAGTPATVVGYYLPVMFAHLSNVYLHIFADAAVRSTVVLAIYGGMLLWLKPSEDLQTYLATVRKNKRLF